MKENEWNWCKCTEENYPTSEGDTLIAYRSFPDEEWQYWKYSDCPFGWNVLCRSEAFFVIIKSPVPNVK